MNTLSTCFLFLVAFDGCGLGAQVLAQVALCELRILRNREVKSLDSVDLEAKLIRTQPELLPVGIRAKLTCAACIRPLATIET